jgi:predicted DCC family thiol-disulfide oxidoreductase YuxK
MASPQQKPEYVLFFMNNCEYCKKIIGMLKSKEELLKKFTRQKL